MGIIPITLNEKSTIVLLMLNKKISQVLRNKSAPKLVEWALGAEEEHIISRLLLKKYLGKRGMSSQTPLCLFS